MSPWRFIHSKTYTTTVDSMKHLHKLNVLAHAITLKALSRSIKTLPGHCYPSIHICMSVHNDSSTLSIAKGIQGPCE